MYVCLCMMHIHANIHLFWFMFYFEDFGLRYGLPSYGIFHGETWALMIHHSKYGNGSPDGVPIWTQNLTGGDYLTWRLYDWVMLVPHWPTKSCKMMENSGWWIACLEDFRHLLKGQFIVGCLDRDRYVSVVSLQKKTGKTHHLQFSHVLLG